MKNEKLTKMIESLVVDWGAIDKAEVRIFRTAKKLCKFAESREGEKAVLQMTDKKRRDYTDLLREIMEYAKARVSSADQR